MTPERRVTRTLLLLIDMVEHMISTNERFADDNYLDGCLDDLYVMKAQLEGSLLK